MTTPADMSMDPTPFASEPDFQNLDWSIGEDGDTSSQEINDRRAKLESAETMRLVRAL